MKTKKISLLTLVLVFLSGITFGQENTRSMELNISEALDYALEHNPNMINADLDIQVAKARVNETIGIGLPQINASASYTNFLDVATTLIPDFISPTVVGINQGLFGLTPLGEIPESDPIPAQFGTEHNAEAGITASQLIFNGSYIVGLQASRTFLKQTYLEKVKTEHELIENVKKSYYTALVAERNIVTLEGIIENLKSTLDQSTALAEEGFIDNISISQIKLMQSELDATLINARNMYKISMYYLKFTLGLDMNDNLVLTEKLDDLLTKTSNDPFLNTKLNLYGNINMQIIENQKQLAVLDLRNKRAEALPVLSGFFSAKQSAQRNEFNFFDDQEEWYPTTLWGLQLDIPIFSGLMRSNQIKQKRLAVEQIAVAQQALETSIGIEYENAKAGYNNAYLIYNNKITNLELAREIFAQTELKFTEGMAGRTDLNQAHDQLLQAETAMMNAILELLNAKATLDRITTES